MKWPTVSLLGNPPRTPEPKDLRTGEIDVPFTYDLRALNAATSTPGTPSMRVVK